MTELMLEDAGDGIALHYWLTIAAFMKSSISYLLTVVLSIVFAYLPSLHVLPASKCAGLSEVPTSGWCFAESVGKDLGFGVWGLWFRVS